MSTSSVPSTGATATARSLFLWSVLLAPISIVLHEVGHLLAAYAVGFTSPTLHFSGVDPGIVANLPTSATGVVALIGPIVSALLALSACVLMAWRGFAPLVAALAVVAVSRFVVSVPYTIGNVIARLLGNELAPPAFDEYVAGTALGWSGNGLLASSSLLLGLVVWRVGKHVPHGQRSTAWLALSLGTAIGWALWMLWLGPRLLP